MVKTVCLNPDCINHNIVCNKRNTKGECGVCGEPVKVIGGSKYTPKRRSNVVKGVIIEI